MNKTLLNSLVGRVVNVYKGGPEANTGVLLGASDDFLVLQTEDGEVIYYTLEHVKSISEDSQVRFQTMLDNLDNEQQDEVISNTNELLHSLKNELVRVDRGGPESRVGTLLDVKNDYFTLYTKKDGLIFYRKKHIKSISKGMTEGNKQSENENNRNENKAKTETMNETDLNKLLDVYNRVSADEFLQLLQNIQYSWIKINRGGPESVEGVLVESNEDFVLLSVKEDVLRIPIYHIKNISVRLKYEQNKEKNDEDEQQNENEQNENQNEQEENQNENNKNDKNENSRNDLATGVVSIQYVNKRNNQNKKQTKFSNVETRRL